MHTITATLTRAAEVRMCLGGAWTLWLELTQQHEPCPIVAVRDYGHGESARQAAYSAATRMPRGEAVRVWCAGIGIGHTHDNRAAIALRGVDQINTLPHSAA